MKLAAALALAVAVSVVWAVVAAPAARADDPKEWPDFAKEKLGGVANGGSEADAVKAFGAAKKKTPATEEAATGEFASDWTFADGVSATMAGPKAKGPFHVRVITVVAPGKPKTSLGIGLGSSLADIKKAYGKFLVDQQNGDWLVGTPYAGLALHLEQDKVTTINFGVMAE